MECNLYITTELNPVAYSACSVHDYVVTIVLRFFLSTLVHLKL